MTKRNPEKTRNNILEAAVQEFSSYGYGGARVDRIADEAGSNKRMIYHYFGNKTGLYDAVFAHLYTKIRRHEMAMDLDPNNPIDALAELAARTFDFFVAHPEVIRVLNDKNLHGDQPTDAPPDSRSLTSDLLDQIQVALDAGVKAGSIRAGIDPIQLYVSIAGLGYFYLSNATTLGNLFDQDLLSPDAIAQRRQHVVDLVRSMVRA